jgi:ADP-ribose pyrophosphatase YjhB (NUDIX family)
MPKVYVATAILDGGQILLTRREDFEVWCLPGGSVEDGETFAQAAVREVYEEIGLEVRITRLVGLYSRPHWAETSSHLVVFAGQPTGGVLRLDPKEVLEAAYFAPTALPAPLIAGDQQPILDALAGVGGSAAWSQAMVSPYPPGITRWQIYAQRDAWCAQTGGSRLDFYHQQFGPQLPIDEEAEVPGRVERVSCEQ